jgi:RNA polymerase sigma factor (sigma-70 family)
MELIVRRDLLLDHARAAVDACDLAQHWGLSPAVRAHYALAVAGLCTSDATPADLNALVINYHLDHEVIEVLRNAAHSEHEPAWRVWMGQVVAILRAEGMAWSNDPTVDVEDLAQIARAEVVRALASYRYRSRASVWLYSVVARCIAKYIRDSRAQKRAQRPDSLYRQDGEVLPIVDERTEQPEAAARARLLLARIRAVLAAHPDGRLAAMFHLWAVEDRQVAEIGEHFGLHPSRVRALLKQAREALQQDDTIRDWNADDDTAP